MSNRRPTPKSITNKKTSESYPIWLIIPQLVMIILVAYELYILAKWQPSGDAEARFFWISPLFIMAGSILLSFLTKGISRYFWIIISILSTIGVAIIAVISLSLKGII